MSITPERRRVRAGALLYFAGAALIALAAVLFLPRARTGGVPITICVADVSASVMRTRPSWKRALGAAIADEARLARERGFDFAVLAFGSDVRRVFGPGSPERYLDDPPTLSMVGDEASPLARALELASELAPGSQRARAKVIVFGDGTWTGEDPRARIQELLERGASVELAPIPDPELADVAIERLELPAGIEAGAPLAAHVELRASGLVRAGRAIELTLACTNASGAFTRTQRLALAREMSADVDLGIAAGGRTSVRASVRVVDGPPDPVPENDSRSASVVSADALSVAVAAPATIRDALVPVDAQSAGFAIEVVDPAAIERVLRESDVLVTAGVPLEAIARAQLATFLRAGGGWLGVAGEEWLAPAAASALDLAPLRPAGDESREIVLLVDGSGSMAGAPYDSVRATVLRLAESAPAAPRIDLRIFAGSLGDRIPIRGGARLVDVLPIAAPGGPTRLFDALDELARASSETPRLVLVFSDGRDDSAPDPVARARAVRERLAVARIDLRAIAAGPSANVERLSSLLADSDAVIRSDGLDDAALADLFSREMASGRFREGRALAVLPAEGGGELARAILSAQTPLAPWPPIGRYLRMQAATGAELVWVSEGGDPLLALHRVGRGIAATVAFSPADASASRGALFAPLLRAIGRSSREQPPSVEVEIGRIVVRDLPPDAPAELHAKIGDGITVRVLPDPNAPDPRTVRTAPAPAALDELASGALHSVVLAGEDGVERWTAMLELPMGGEFRPSAADPSELRDFAAATSARPREATLATGHPAARNVLALGLLCLCAGTLLGGLRRRALPETGRGRSRSQAL